MELNTTFELNWMKGIEFVIQEENNFECQLNRFSLDVEHFARTRYTSLEEMISWELKIAQIF